MRRGRSSTPADGSQRGAVDEDDDASDGELAALRRGVADGVERPSRARRSKFSPEQQANLVNLFEEHGHKTKGYLEAIMEGLGAEFSAGQVRRELKALGLRRGQPTERQVPPSSVHAFCHGYCIVNVASVTLAIMSSKFR